MYFLAVFHEQPSSNAQNSDWGIETTARRARATGWTARSNAQNSDWGIETIIKTANAIAAGTGSNAQNSDWGIETNARAVFPPPVLPVQTHRIPIGELKLLRRRGRRFHPCRVQTHRIPIGRVGRVVTDYAVITKTRNESFDCLHPLGSSYSAPEDCLHHANKKRNQSIH